MAELSGKTASNLREEADQHRAERLRSQRDSDTDGFLSQWASGLTAQLKDHEADIQDNGGVWEFPALFDLDGNRVRAKLTTRTPFVGYGKEEVWKFFEADDRPAFRYPIKAFTARASTMEKKGFREGTETVEAEAFMNGSGSGLSGSAWGSTRRIGDNGYPKNAIPAV